MISSYRNILLIKNTSIILLTLVLGLGNCKMFAQVPEEPSAFEQALIHYGYNKEAVNDYSSINDISIEEPQRAYINITGIDEFPQNKYSKKYIDMHAWAEVYDGNGNYFKKHVLLNAQGNSSLHLDKKNFALDFCEDEWAGDSTTTLTIGDWVPQDGFHFKAFYNDYFRGLGEVAYKVYDQITEEEDPIWVRAGIKDGGKALCHPEGFPCAVYLNGKFYGLFAWQLKKHRANMAMTKDLAEHIHLDGDLCDDLFFRGTINWTRFEIRNPKNLYCIDTEEVSGYIYTEITNDKDELAQMGENYEIATDNPKDMSSTDLNADSPLYYKYITSKGKIKYYKLTEQSGLTYIKYDGNKPKELIDETMPYFDANNKNHVMTAKVKKYIITMANNWDQLNALEEAGADTETMRAEIAKRYDIDALLDYQIHLDILQNCDGVLKNWQWFTYDGLKWYVTPYDLDQTFGMVLSGGRPRGANTWINKITSGPFYWITKYYTADKELRYKKLRYNGHILADRINDEVIKWYDRVGEDFIEQEKMAWPESSCYNEPICSPGWKLSDRWNLCGKTNYDDAATYHAGDIITLDYGVWEATETVTGVKPYIRNSFTDSIPRVTNWVVERIACVDTKYGYNPAKDIDSYSLGISAAEWATICVPFSFRVPEELKAYSISCTDQDGATLTLTDTATAFANKPYIVNGPEGTYLLSGIKETADPKEADYLKNGLLRGVYEDTYVPKDSYILQKHGDNVGFYFVSEDNLRLIGKNRAYLTLNTIGNIQAFYLNDGLATSISNTNISTPSSGMILNLQGIRLQAPAKGLNIVLKDGRYSKVLKK